MFCVKGSSSLDLSMSSLTSKRTQYIQVLFLIVYQCFVQFRRNVTKSELRLAMNLQTNVAPETLLTTINVDAALWQGTRPTISMWPVSYLYRYQLNTTRTSLFKRLKCRIQSLRDKANHVTLFSVTVKHNSIGEYRFFQKIILFRDNIHGNCVASDSAVSKTNVAAYRRQ